MATISKHPHRKGWRVRYYIIYPDGVRIDRSRLCKTIKEAQALCARATLLEEMTRFKTYNISHVHDWRAAGLLSNKDYRVFLNVFPEAERALQITLGELADFYLELSQNLSRREFVARRSRLKRILSVLDPKLPISLLKPSDGAFLVKELLRKGLAPATVNKSIRDLKRMLEFAVEDGYLSRNPFKNLKPVKDRNPFRPRVLSPEEVEKVLAEARRSRLLYGWIYLVLLLAFGCGLRRSEILALRWEWIDWEKRLIRVQKTKTGKIRFVGIGKKLYEELLRLKEALEKNREAKGKILPPFYPDSLTTAAKRLFRKCGLEDVRFHDARHTYVTHIQILAGASPVEAMARSGHSEIDMLIHYSHPAAKIIYEDRLPYLGT